MCVCGSNEYTGQQSSEMTGFTSIYIYVCVCVCVWRQADHPTIRVVPAMGFVAVLGNSVFTCFRRGTSEVRLLFLDVTSSRGTVTSCVTSRHCTCTGHVTFCYKRSADVSFEALLALSSGPLVCPSGLPLSPAYGWCLMRVGCDESSASLGWSLLPSSVIIVLALVNSAVSPGGLRYLNKTRECCPTPCQYRFHRTAVPFGWCPCASW